MTKPVFGTIKFKFFYNIRLVYAEDKHIEMTRKNCTKKIRFDHIQRQRKRTWWSLV